MRSTRIRRHAARTREGARSHRYAAGCCRSGTPLHPPHAPFALRQAARKPKNFAATSASRTPRRPNTPRPRRIQRRRQPLGIPGGAKQLRSCLSYPFSIFRNTEPAGRGFGVCCYPSSSACLFTVRMVRLFFSALTVIARKIQLAVHVVREEVIVCIRREQRGVDRVVARVADRTHR